MPRASCSAARAASPESGDVTRHARRDRPRMTRTEYQPEAPPERSHRNWWIWISAVLAVVIVGLIVWQVNTQNDLDAAQKQVTDLQAHVTDLQGQIDQGKQAGNDAAASYQAAYKDLQAELGATQQDLAS